MEAKYVFAIVCVGIIMLMMCTCSRDYVSHLVGAKKAPAKKLDPKLQAIMTKYDGLKKANQVKIDAIEHSYDGVGAQLQKTPFDVTLVERQRGYVLAVLAVQKDMLANLKKYTAEKFRWGISPKDSEREKADLESAIANNQARYKKVLNDAYLANSRN